MFAVRKKRIFKKWYSFIKNIKIKNICNDTKIIETKTKIHFDKLNIFYNVPITPFEAALGEEITIPTFDGKIKLIREGAVKINGI